jgi:hypothetical protein
VVEIDRQVITHSIGYLVLLSFNVGRITYSNMIRVTSESPDEPYLDVALAGNRPRASPKQDTLTCFARLMIFNGNYSPNYTTLDS